MISMFGVVGATCLAPTFNPTQRDITPTLGGRSNETAKEFWKTINQHEMKYNCRRQEAERHFLQNPLLSDSDFKVFDA
jgi:hypothetical protein